MSRKHGIVPDTQAKPGVSLNHMKWAGDYFAEKKPDVIVHVGDHWDMPSLSNWDKGTMAAEGRAYEDDIKAGNLAMDLFMAPIRAEQARQKRAGIRPWRPRLVFTIGNHEQRIMRHVNAHPELRRTLGYHAFNLVEHGWEVHDFLHPVKIDGISYQHYVPNPNTGRPWGGMAEPRLSKIGFSFVAGHEQGKKSGERYLQNNTVQRALIVGCLAPHHRVLTADLRYVPIGSLQPGAQLLAFDEDAGSGGQRSRRYRTGKLLRTDRAMLPCYEVRLASGKVFVASETHQWLRRTGTLYNWCLTTQLRAGTRLPRIMEEWETADSFAAGWLAGMYDGEGCLYLRNTSAGNATQLTLAQKHGPILDKFADTLEAVCGVRAGGARGNGRVYNVHVQGGQRQIAKVLGMLRPERLLEKFTPNALGRIACPEDVCDVVQSVRPVGLQEVVLTDVDCKTYIAEGFGHHNSYYLHDEDYKGPQGNHHWRGICMLHEVSRGNFDLMEVSLNYLRRRYYEKRPTASRERIAYAP